MSLSHRHPEKPFELSHIKLGDDQFAKAAEWEAASRENAPSGIERHLHDAVLALISLGYKQVDAHKAVKAVMPRLSADSSSEDVVRESLRNLLS